MRYANDSGGVARTLSIAVNGTAAGKVTLVPTTNWDTWDTATVQVPVTAGSDTVALSCAADDTCMVNVDYLGLSASGAPAHLSGHRSHR